MSSISIEGMQSIGPFLKETSVTVSGYINGTIRFIDGNGNLIVKSRQFNHENASVTIGPIRTGVQVSGVVEDSTAPAFHGTFSFSNGYTTFSNSDLTSSQLSTYSRIRILRTDSYGTNYEIYSGDITNTFSVTLQSNSSYVVELLCGSSGGGSGSGTDPDDTCDCDDKQLAVFTRSDSKTTITRSDIPSIYTAEGATMFGDNRNLIQIMKISSDGNTRTMATSVNYQTDFSVTMESGYTYEMNAVCSCKHKDIIDFDVSEYSDCDLTPYQNAAQFGITDGTPWRLIETGYPYKYFEGTVQNGVFEGLPDRFRPIRYTYTGHMKLQIGCFTNDAINNDCEWSEDYDFPECVQHDGPSFTSGQTVDLSSYRNTGTQFGTMADGMTWGLFDVTHNEFVLRGVYSYGTLYETEGSSAVDVTSQSVLRSTYTSNYSGTTEYKFVMRCDGNFPSYNWYVIGYCAKRSTDTELTGEHVTGELNTLYVITETAMYPANTCYQNKRMNTLAGPYDTRTDAENFKSNNSSSLYRTLEQQCQNRMTLDITWSGDNGCDLDISFVIEGVTMGWSQNNSSPYATWYGDDTSCGGAEQVSIDKNAMIAAGIKSSTIQIRAHWYSSRYNGSCVLTVSDGSTSVNRTYNSTTQESSSSNYDSLGTVVLDLEHDTFSVNGGSGNSSSALNSLMAALPEDLR